MAYSVDSHREVTWRFKPARASTADLRPTRLAAPNLLNLLSNARKFTDRGQISPRRGATALFRTACMFGCKIPV
ncbi:MAG: hypothetical protein U0401_14075 [Anaerolineae bacterium]